MCVWGGTDLVVADVVVTFVYALSVCSVAQGPVDVLDIWDAVDDCACWPASMSLRYTVKVDWREGT